MKVAFGILLIALFCMSLRPGDCPFRDCPRLLKSEKKCDSPAVYSSGEDERGTFLIILLRMSLMPQRSHQLLDLPRREIAYQCKADAVIVPLGGGFLLLSTLIGVLPACLEERETVQAITECQPQSAHFLVSGDCHIVGLENVT